MTLERKTGIVIAILGWIAIASLTLRPHPADAGQVVDLPLNCLVCGESGAQDVVLNILLFVPLGIGLGLWRVPRRRAILAVVLTTLCVETIQFAFLAGRDASLSDVMTNSAGGLLGIAAGWNWLWLVQPGPRHAQLLAWLAAAFWLATLAGTGVLLAVRLPETVYFGQWAPQLGQFDQFPGKVESVTLNGRTLPGQRMMDSPRVRAVLESDSFTVSVRAVAGALTERIAPMISIFDDHEQEILVLGQWRHGLVFRLRSRASGILLREPAVALGRVFSGKAPDSIEVSATVERGHVTLRAASAGNPARTIELDRTPAWGWTFLIPGTMAFGSAINLLSGVWLGALILPFGFWLGRAEVGWLVAPACGVIIVLGLAGIPLLTHMPAVGLPGWLGTVAGVLAGAGVARIIPELSARRT
ncbi:MAG: VanZ family protein [Gemmatimonadota bacterium]